MIRYQPLPYQDTPTSAFSTLRAWHWPILLDSQDAGRWDIFSADPCATVWQDSESVWHVHGLAASVGTNNTPRDAFSWLQHLQSLRPAQSRPLHNDGELQLPFHGGVLGYIGYAAVSERGLPPRRHDDWPLAALAYYSWAVCTDHQEKQSWLVWQDEIAADLQQRIMHWAGALTATDTKVTTDSIHSHYSSSANSQAGADRFSLSGPFQACTSEARYAQDIARIHDYIRAGDCYQVNYTQAWQAPCSGSVWPLYPALRAAAKAPYACFWQLPWGELVSLSPEQFLAISAPEYGIRQVTTRPIKGTRRRSSDPLQDLAEAQALLSSTKDQAENIMITDLLRNDLSKHAELGSVHVSQLCALESFGQVHHLVSTIHAQLNPGASTSEVLRDAFPGGSITGAPKKRAMEIIEELEVSPRGVYCGSIVLHDCLGQVNSSITIRTLTAKDGVLRTWAGGGITLDSRWEDELQECWSKMGGLMRIFEQWPPAAD